MNRSAPHRRVPPPIPEGADAIVHRFMGSWHRRQAVAARLAATAREAEAHATGLADLSSREFARRLREARDGWRRARHDSPRGRPEAAVSLALLREAAVRALNQRPYDVQLMGVAALHQGGLAEMATGEGKTLTAGLAAILFGWSGHPCHVVTVNDYLVERDTQFLRPLYELCGLRPACVTAAMAPDERREAYRADVVYGTSREFAADFLRDRLLRGGAVPGSVRALLRGAGGSHRLEVQRGLHTAIVDEADSLLIDEAVTPLIISAKAANEPLKEAVRAAARLTGDFHAGEHYLPRPRHRDIELTPRGEAMLEGVAPRMEGMWTAPGRCRELIRQALTAREFYRRGHQYLVDDGKVVIVDEFTGRPMPDRSWRQGLHQAVEAAEGLDLTDPSETLARVSFQRFFRLYHRLCGMTGTAAEAAGELWHVYGLPVVPIPVNRPSQRTIRPARYFADEESKLTALVDRVRMLHGQEVPVLVGTRSVRASECLAERLSQAGVLARVLNATRLREEAVIVAGAGERGQLTIATNMAGRGTDIRLGAGVAGLGGLHVISAERSESRRVDRQLIGRCARQGDPGVAESFASADDELLTRFVPTSVRHTLAEALRRGWPGAGSLANRLFAQAQGAAQRQARRQRGRVLEADTWLEGSLSFSGPEGF